MIFIKKHKIFLVMILIMIILVVPFSIIHKIYKINFDVRVNNTINLYDDVAKEKPEFKREPISFRSDKGQILNGNLYYYSKQNSKALIVLAHGYGRDSDSYAQEAEYFAKNGFLVMSYDNTGTVMSEGKSLKGVSQAPIDLDYALRFIAGNIGLKDYEILLYGHSWGGFAVTAVNNYPHKIKAIVSVSGLENLKSLVTRRGESYVGNFIKVLLPYCQVYEVAKFGTAAFNTGSKGLRNTKAKVFIIHSTDDWVVPYEDSYRVYLKNFEGNPRFEFLLLSEYGHNPVLSLDTDNTLGQSRRLEVEHMEMIVDFYNSALAVERR